MFVILIIAVCTMLSQAGNFQIGSGIYDITGESTEGGFMGYAVTSQKGSGIHMRMRSRAFVIVDPLSGSRVVYVSMDMCMGFQMMKTDVIDKLTAHFGSNMYNDKNVLLSGTHTHSTPGGVGGTVLVDITTYGFIKHNYEAAVEGVYMSIVNAHNNLVAGDIKVAQGVLDDANINRSPTSYLHNTAEERSHYKHDTDHNMTVLRFDADDGTSIGVVSIFSVHGTSMNSSNTLVSSDNKGLASQLFEQAMNPKGTLPGQGKFVAAFGQSNEGDVSPNTKGPSCPDGSPCDSASSTCGGRSQGCTAKGPGANMQESTFIIGAKQYKMASSLYAEADTVIQAGLDYRHQYFDMENFNVAASFSSTGQEVKTCDAALGYSFAAGTTDGPGDFDFTQGSNSTNPFWAFVSSFLSKPTKAQVQCQHPKPILLNVGCIKPTEWVPSILPVQIIRVGQLWIIGFPGEATTMTGRRLRNQLRDTLIEQGVWTDDMIVIIAGLANSYSHYTATYQEYQQQRYEAASTLYGPHSADAYQQIIAELTTAMAKGESVPSGPTPPDHRNHTISFQPPVIYDSVPFGKKFGDIASDVQSSYTMGETALAKFWCASPRNDLLTEKTFMTVEQLQSDGSYKVIATDSNWETKFHWARHDISYSYCTLTWDIPTNVAPGQYRFQTFGVSRTILGTKTAFSGTSKTFTVVTSGSQAVIQ